MALISILVSLLVVAIGLPAQASVSKTYCNGRSYKHVVKTYHRGTAALPLRCGKASWGFHHLTHRWNAAFDATIALTIARGESANDVQGDGGSKLYVLFNNRCVEVFRVIYNGGAYLGNGIKPQGIITAYPPTIGPVAVFSTNSSVKPAYRTDCPIIQEI
jgi:hypothetical protein